MAIQRTEDNIFIRYATAIAIGTITFLMIFATLFFWQQGKASQAAKEWVIHTYDVRGHIRLLFSGLKDNPVQQAFRYRATANITARLAF